MTQRVTIKIDKAKLDRLEAHYLKDKKDNSNEYIVFFAKNDKVVVSAYSSKKQQEFKVVFVGETALEEAKIWDINAEINVPKKVEVKKASWILLDDQIGSDEVGTGDFFGPISVTAAYVSRKDIDYLKKLGVDDSKRLSDDQIRELGKKLINKIPYSQISLGNEKYNELVTKGMNMNEMKVKMHNQVLKNLHAKFPKVNNFVIDQFLEADKYYAYLIGEEEAIDSITFKTKGESYYPAIAVASIISRYSFLQKMDAMSEKYGFEIPFGASPKVKVAAVKIAKKFGKNELDKIVKKNFTTYDEVISAI